MTYEELPLIDIKVTRGNTQEVILLDFSLDDIPVDVTETCPKIVFKTTVDACRYIDFELTVENGGLVIGADRIVLKFGRETSRLGLDAYWGDLLMRFGDLDVTVVRFKLELEGVTTIKNSDEC